MEIIMGIILGISPAKWLRGHVNSFILYGAGAKGEGVATYFFWAA
jgi:hypothetical protein